MLLTANALLALRTGWENGSTVSTVVAVTLFVAAAMAVGYGGWRKRQLLNADTPFPPPSFVMAALAAVTLLPCIAGILSVLAVH